MASCRAPALPMLCFVWYTLAPADRAIATVLSVEPSDTTWTFHIGMSSVIAARLSAMTSASLCAGMRTATSPTVSPRRSGRPRASRERPFPGPGDIPGYSASM